MILTVTHHTRLDPARWEIALNLLAVLAIDTRCRRLLCHHDRPIQFHDTPNDFFTRDTTWDPQQETHILEPYYQFRIQFNIAGCINGSIDCGHAHDLSTVQSGIAAALATPYTIANRRKWELDELRRDADARGDDALSEELLEEQRHHARIAYTAYDRVDRERLQRRHAAFQRKLPPLSSEQERQWIFDQLINEGQAIRSGQTPPPHTILPLPA